MKEMNTLCEAYRSANHEHETCRKLSAESGQGVAVASGACVLPVVPTGTEPAASVAALQVESAAHVLKAPSCRLRWTSSVGELIAVKLMKLTYTWPVVGGVSPGNYSSAAIQLRSSMVPGVVPLPFGSEVKVSPKSVDVLTVTV